MMRKALLILMGIAMLSSRCRDKQQGLVPNVPFERTINVLAPEFFDLQVPGGWVYHTGGSRGIIIYRKTENEFVILERHSPYRPEDNCAVVVMDDGVIIQDPCSNSQWLIMDGSIVNGPTAYPLRTYAYSYQEPYLYIYN
ncbi:MAG TPA: hypothetical protein VIK71_07740 [Flavobacteriales bacterium]|jgi:hypothetical protein